MKRMLFRSALLREVEFYSVDVVASGTPPGCPSCGCGTGIHNAPGPYTSRKVAT